MVTKRLNLEKTETSGFSKVSFSKNKMSLQSKPSMSSRNLKASGSQSSLKAQSPKQKVRLKFLGQQKLQYKNIDLSAKAPLPTSGASAADDSLLVQEIVDAAIEMSGQKAAGLRCIKNVSMLNMLNAFDLVIKSGANQGVEAGQATRIYRKLLKLHRE